MVNQEGTFKIKKVNDIVVISTLTDFTLSMERIMEDLYQELCNNGYKKIIFEFNPENHITSAGIAILISLIDEGTKNNQIIGFIGLSSHFKKIFNLIGITRYATIYNSVEQAIHNMSGAFSSEYTEQSN
ncbi:MAG: STAS domain-containing protein [bacterium]